ncbi:MAG: ParB N-terminal domain-containing protein [Clostridia bacterium]|nr:ParB N-terminal domain-containing protein [Clostridia bacterium]
MSRFIVPMKGSPFAFRKDEAYESLKRSITQFGVIESITVLEPERYVRTDGNYQIISGRRRYEACKELGIIDIPTRVLRMPADDALIALIDMNLCQRFTHYFLFASLEKSLDI